MLKIIVNELRKDKYPFEAEHDRDRLVIRWKKNWAQRRRKDLNRIDIRSMTNEIRDFRYVVYLNDDHTFYGYDTNSLALAKGDINTQGSQEQPQSNEQGKDRDQKWQSQPDEKEYHCYEDTCEHKYKPCTQEHGPGISFNGNEAVAVPDRKRYLQIPGVLYKGRPDLYRCLLHCCISGTVYLSQCFASRSQ